MKVIVIRPFMDKDTKEIRPAGQEIEVTKERFDEINSHPCGPLLQAKRSTRKKVGG